MAIHKIDKLIESLKKLDLVQNPEKGGAELRDAIAALEQYRNNIPDTDDLKMSLFIAKIHMKFPFDKDPNRADLGEFCKNTIEYPPEYDNDHPLKKTK